MPHSQSSQGKCDSGAAAWATVYGNLIERDFWMHGFGMEGITSEESTRLAHERKTLEEEAIDWVS